ncbi:MAG: hypothetical protein JZU50_12935 [Desulfobulbaceae bacterium]|nr:hypothetical protein [Desulfobulbaceae bacterium]
MMRNRFSLILLVVTLCLLTAGCGQKKKMESADQWNVLANDLANRINNELIRQHYLNASVYVRHSCGKPNNCRPGGTFPFDEGFNDMLTTQLASFGVNITRTPEGAGLIVDYKVQMVYHGSYEVIITTSIMERDKYVMRSSDVYAIDAEDYWQYRSAIPATEIELTNRAGFKQTPKASTAK